jgi:hypothetical protein
MKKVTGLAAFTKRGADESKASGEIIAPERQRGKREVVALTFRLPRAQWERLHQLAVSEGVSIQTLAMRGLSQLFEAKGLPGIE